MQAVEKSDEDFKSIIAYPLHGNCYLNITSRCTLRCAFCPKYNRSWEVQSYDLRLHREPTVEEVLEAVGDPGRYREIVFCGLGEPTVRLDALLAIARELKKKGARIRVNSDGLANLREGRDVTAALAEVVDTLSISMNAQDEQTYIKHTRPKMDGAFEAMLEFARLAHERGIAVSLTAIDGLDGVDIAACERIARSLGVEFRHRKLDVVG
ncbi:MAG: TatD family nuclease-associated radical SAM protein [Gammaproteobacteria bacterium]|nr:TatD family nuclease-associated radical SAM protein [Gammaproteobacteria bacterium]